MGIYYTIALKIEGQIKPIETGELVQKEIELLCMKYGLEIIEDKSGFSADGFERL